MLTQAQGSFVAVTLVISAFSLDPGAYYLLASPWTYCLQLHLHSLDTSPHDHNPDAHDYDDNFGLDF